MKTIYRSNDGKDFESKESCINHENKLKTLKNIFNKLVDENFFQNYKIVPFIHNVKIDNLGNPKKSDWNNKYCGYVLMGGRMGNGDTVVSFKLRNNKLLIFRWSTDDSEDKRYLGSIIINNRKEKLNKIVKNIN
jgi:hypothetical protein